jgi:hypothetical protein
MGRVRDMAQDDERHLHSELLSGAEIADDALPREHPQQPPILHHGQLQRQIWNVAWGWPPPARQLVFPKPVGRIHALRGVPRASSVAAAPCRREAPPRQAARHAPQRRDLDARGGRGPPVGQRSARAREHRGDRRDVRSPRARASRAPGRPRIGAGNWFNRVHRRPRLRILHHRLTGRLAHRRLVRLNPASRRKRRIATYKSRIPLRSQLSRTKRTQPTELMSLPRDGAVRMVRGGPATFMFLSPPESE